ncbi:MAG: hypothetical protein WB780_06700 [Candidatus Acidiferrales bacterium]
MLRKLRFSLALPIVQVVITAVLTLWADRVDWLFVDSKRLPGSFVHVHFLVLALRPIWRGVNAPTWPLCLAGSSNYSILGFSAGELLYLAAVAALWYLVGRFLDRRRGLQPPVSHQSPLRKNVFAVCTIVWGIVLFAVSLLSLDSIFPVTFSGTRLIRLENVTIYTLFLLWSFLLITIPVRKFVLAVRFRKTNG